MVSLVLLKFLSSCKFVNFFNTAFEYFLFFIRCDASTILLQEVWFINKNRDFIRQLIIFDSMNEEKYLIIDQMEVDANQPFILVYHAPED